MSHVIEYTYPAIYRTGRSVREAGGRKAPPAYLSICDRHWWLAGWNDMDIEMGGSYEDARLR